MYMCIAVDMQLIIHVLCTVELTCIIKGCLGSAIITVRLSTPILLCIEKQTVAHNEGHFWICSFSMRFVSSSELQNILLV